MTSKNRVRGFNVEREIVKKVNQHAQSLVDNNLYSEVPFSARRAWGSNGEAMGFDRIVDVFIEDATLDKGGLRIQSKRQKVLPQYLFPQELKKRDKIDALVLREDGDANAHLIVMNLDYFLKEFLR